MGHGGGRPEKCWGQGLTAALAAGLWGAGGRQASHCPLHELSAPGPAQFKQPPPCTPVISPSQRPCCDSLLQAHDLAFLKISMVPLTNRRPELLRYHMDALLRHRNYRSLPPCVHGRAEG